MKEANTATLRYLNEPHDGGKLCTRAQFECGPRAMAKMRGASLADLAQSVGWLTKDGKPYRSLVQRTLNALREDKLVKKESGRWVLTKAGLKEADLAAEIEDEIPF